MTSIWQEMLISSALPALAVGLLFFFTGTGSDPWRARLQSLIFALGFVAAAIFMTGKFEFPPQNAALAFAVAALFLSVFVWISPRPVGSRYLLRAIFVLAAGALVLWPIHQTIHGPVYTRNLLAFFFLGLGVWSILEKATQKVQVSTLVILPLLSLALVTVLLLHHNGIGMAKVTTLLSVMFAAAGVAALIWPKRVSAAAMLPFVSVLVVMAMAAGHFYLHINPWHMIYLCVPFLLLWIRAWLPFIPRRPLIETVVLGILALLPMIYFLTSVGVKIGPLH